MSHHAAFVSNMIRDLDDSNQIFAKRGLQFIKQIVLENVDIGAALNLFRLLKCFCTPRQSVSSELFHIGSAFGMLQQFTMDQYWSSCEKSVCYSHRQNRSEL